METEQLRESKLKGLQRFIFEELNMMQALKAITQWLILLTMLYSAWKLTEIVNLLR